MPKSIKVESTIMLALDIESLHPKIFSIIKLVIYTPLDLNLWLEKILFEIFPLPNCQVKLSVFITFGEK